MPIALAAGAVAIAGAAAVFRPHSAPALRMSSDPARERPALARSRGAPLDGAPASPNGAARVVVYVTGEVKRPGVYSIESRSRVDGAVRAASGPTANADLLAVNLAEPLSDGEKILVPAKGAPPNADAYMPATTTYPPLAGSGYSTHRRHRRSSPGASARHGRSRRSHKTPPSEPIDLNAADATQLEQLPGIGASLAERIVTFRDVNGPYRSTDELLDVSGMTDKRLDAISQYLMVRPP